MVFQQHEPSIWQYAKDGDEIVGTVLNIEDSKAFENKKVYHLETDCKKQITIFGTTVLDSKMIGIKIGDKIKIVFKGTKEGEKGKNATKLFVVFKDVPEEKKN